jgi:hypothetical protein
LEAAARAATPGPWNHTGTEYYDRGGRYQNIESPIEIIIGESGVCSENAAFIAAANPAVVLALVERVRTAEERANMGLPPVTQCPKCFHVYQPTLGDNERTLTAEAEAEHYRKLAGELRKQQINTDSLTIGTVNGDAVLFGSAEQVRTFQAVMREREKTSRQAVIEECIEIAGGDHTADPFGDQTQDDIVAALRELLQATEAPHAHS